MLLSIAKYTLISIDIIAIVWLIIDSYKTIKK